MNLLYTYPLNELLIPQFCPLQFPKKNRTTTTTKQQTQVQQQQNQTLLYNLKTTQCVI